MSTHSDDLTYDQICLSFGRHISRSEDAVFVETYLMAIVDGNCRVEIYIHIFIRPNQEQKRKMQL